jgi:hypothetical protein
MYIFANLDTEEGRGFIQLLLEMRDSIISVCVRYEHLYTFIPQFECVYKCFYNSPISKFHDNVFSSSRLVSHVRTDMRQWLLKQAFLSAIKPSVAVPDRLLEYGLLTETE